MKKPKVNDWHEARWIITHLASKTHEKKTAKQRRKHIETWTICYILIGDRLK